MKIKLSLRTKILIITTFIYVCLIGSVLTLTYFRFRQNMYNTYVQYGQEILNNVVTHINAEHIPDYLEGKYMDEYNASHDLMSSFVKSSNGILQYIYIYIIPDDSTNAIVVFDADSKTEAGDKIGSLYALDPPFAEIIDDLRAGKHIKYLTSDNVYGNILTCMHPISNKAHTYQAYAFIDFDLAAIRDSNIHFIIQIIIAAAIIMIGFLFLGMHFMFIRIIDPINKMYECLNSFRYDSTDAKIENLKKLHSLNIHTNTEIQSLYNMLIKTTEDAYTYMEEYQIAAQRLGVANELAYNDSLTNLHNKHSYDVQTEEYNRAIENGVIPEVAVIMLDINNLKYINDKFGHHKGDKYIIGCCDIIKSIVKSSIIYRIGGDEFVIFLQGADYKNRKAIYTKLKYGFDEAYTDTALDVWMRYSASIGMSEMLSSDSNIERVIKRADSEMYREKALFKDKYGSYR